MVNKSKKKSFNFQHRVNNINRKTSTPLTKAQVSSAASCSDEEDDESDEDDDDDEKSEDDDDNDGFEFINTVNILFKWMKSISRRSGCHRAKATWS